MKYKGVVQERLKANINTLELLLKKLTQGVLKPSDAQNMLKIAIKRDKKCLDLTDLERESHGFGSRDQDNKPVRR